MVSKHTCISYTIIISNARDKFSIKVEPDGFFKHEKIELSDKIIYLNGVSDNGDIVGVFVKEDYKFLKPENEIVVDVGANIGDTAIYFAFNNCKKVIALEPYPYTFEFAKINVKRNELENSVILLNAGYGKDGEILIDESKRSTTGSDLQTVGAGKKIKIYSLKTLVSVFALDNALLKMDCEGCEYSILEEDISTVKKFKRIQIEYHYGYEKLYDFLKTDFKVTFTKPKKVFIKDSSNPYMKIGWIYAERKYI